MKTYDYESYPHDSYMSEKDDMSGEYCLTEDYLALKARLDEHEHEPVTTSKCRVGNTVFVQGCKVSTVLKRAYREYEYKPSKRIY